MMEQAIDSIPNSDTINVWHLKKDILRGTKEMGSQNTVTFVKANQKFTLIQKLEHLFVVAIIGTLRSMGEYFLMKNVKTALKQLGQDGLAKDLGITKEGVQRLIWLLEDVRNTRSGLEISSLEMILLVINALLKERILKQTITQLDLRQLSMRKELPPMRKQWRVGDYGTKVMAGHYVGSVTEVTA